jgi:hypothetical protein
VAVSGQSVNECCGGLVCNAAMFVDISSPLGLHLANQEILMLGFAHD